MRGPAQGRYDAGAVAQQIIWGCSDRGGGELKCVEVRGWGDSVMDCRPFLPQSVGASRRLHLRNRQ